MAAIKFQLVKRAIWPFRKKEPTPEPKPKYPIIRKSRAWEALQGIYGEKTPEVVGAARKYRAEYPLEPGSVKFETPSLEEEALRRTIPVHYGPYAPAYSSPVRLPEEEEIWSPETRRRLADYYAKLPSEFRTARRPSVEQRMTRGEEVSSHPRQSPLGGETLEILAEARGPQRRLLERFEQALYRPIRDDETNKTIAMVDLGHASTPIELPVKLARIKQFYYMQTGKLATTPEEALEAWRWAYQCARAYSSRHKLERDMTASLLADPLKFYSTMTGKPTTTFQEAAEAWEWIHDWHKAHPFRYLWRGGDILFWVDPDKLDPDIRDQLLNAMPGLVMVPEGIERPKLAMRRIDPMAAIKFQLYKPAQAPIVQPTWADKALGWAAGKAIPAALGFVGGQIAQRIPEEIERAKRKRIAQMAPPGYQPEVFWKEMETRYPETQPQAVFQQFYEALPTPVQTQLIEAGPEQATTFWQPYMTPEGTLDWPKFQPVYSFMQEFPSAPGDKEWPRQLEQASQWAGYGLGGAQMDLSHYLVQDPATKAWTYDAPRFKADVRTMADFHKDLSTVGVEPEQFATELREFGGEGTSLADPVEFVRKRYYPEGKFQAEKFKKDWDRRGELREISQMARSIGITPGDLGTSAEQFMDMDDESVKEYTQTLRQVQGMVGPGKAIKPEQLQRAIGFWHRLGDWGVLKQGKQAMLGKFNELFIDKDGNLKEKEFRTAVVLSSLGEVAYKKLWEEKDPKAWLALVGVGVGLAALLRLVFGIGGEEREPAPAAPQVVMLPAPAATEEQAYRFQLPSVKHMRPEEWLAYISSRMPVA